MPPISPDNANPDVSTVEKAALPEWHVKKWAMNCLVRINGNLLGWGRSAALTRSIKDKTNPDYCRWVDEYAPEILNLVFMQLNEYKNVGAYGGAEAQAGFYYQKLTIQLFLFLRSVVDVAKLYRLIKAHMTFIINEVFPKALAITPEERELWVEDPIQFVNQVYDTYYDCSNVRSDAGDFLVYLSKVRANDILNPFLNFLMSSFDTCLLHARLTSSYNATAPDKRDYMAKEWMLYALELLSGNLLSKDNIRGNVEKVLVDYVYPEFSSPLGFLRARACRLYSSFRKLDLDPAHLESVVASLIRCLDDPEFPVCVSAAISLQSYLNDESRMNLVRPHIRHVVERFITLLQKVTVEEVMQSFDTIINKFQDELLPLSSEILAVLMAAFQEYKKDNDNDTAMFTAMTTIECISSIVINAVAVPQYYDAVVTQVMPCVMEVLGKQEVDFYDAAMMIVRSIVNYYENSGATKDSAFCTGA